MELNRKGRKLVRGVGVNDSVTPTSKSIILDGYNPSGGRKYKKVWTCPYYIKWDGMLSRCYGKRTKATKAWDNCTVCEDWLLFSNFKKWVDAQPCRDWEDMDLDKDLLSSNSKVYSTESCVFVCTKVNGFIKDDMKPKGLYMMGVSWCDRSKPFVASCKDPFKRVTPFIGRFYTEIEAHKAWKERKHKYALDLVDIVDDDKIKEVLKCIVSDLGFVEVDVEELEDKWS